MNSLSKNFIKNVTGLLVLSISLAGMTSCSSNKDEGVSNIEGTTLNITVKGLEELGSAAGAVGATNSKMRAAVPNGQAGSSQDGELISLGQLDALVSVEENRISSNANITKNTSSAALASAGNDTTYTEGNALPLGNKLLAATQAMGPNIKYRILLYDATNNLVVNTVATSGVNPQIQIYANRKYTWYAFSVNETGGTVPNINSAGIIAKSEIANKDVLYASGSINTINGANYLDVTFKRNTARIQVKLDTRGLFGTIDNATSISVLKNSGNTNVIQIGDLNIKTGAYSNLVNTSPVLASSMTAVSGTPTSTVKIANFYTVNTTAIAANSFKIRLNTLKVGLDDTRVRTFAPNLTYNYSNAYTPAIGSTYALNIRLIESPVKVNGVLWARSNLVYNGSHMDRYRLKSNPGGSSSATRDTEFWNWKSTTPGGAAGNFDACASVYPAGTWRMPTKAEWESIGQPDDKREVLGLFWGAQYGYLWNRDSDYPANTAYDDNNLFLSFGGYRTTNWLGQVVVSGSPSGIVLGAFAAGECHYWTSDSQNTNNAYAVKSSFTRVAWLFSWGNVTYPSASKTEGRNVRCVRAKVNPTS